MCLYVLLHILCTYLQSLEEGAGSPGAKVTGACEPTDVGAQN